MNLTNDEITKNSFQESRKVKKDIIDNGEYKKIILMAIPKSLHLSMVWMFKNQGIFLSK